MLFIQSNLAKLSLHELLSFLRFSTLGLRPSFQPSCPVFWSAHSRFPSPRSRVQDRIQTRTLRGYSLALNRSGLFSQESLRLGRVSLVSLGTVFMRPCLTTKNDCSRTAGSTSYTSCVLFRCTGGLCGTRPLAKGTMKPRCDVRVPWPPGWPCRTPPRPPPSWCERSRLRLSTTAKPRPLTACACRKLKPQGGNVQRQGFLMLLMKLVVPQNTG